MMGWKRSQQLGLIRQILYLCLLMLAILLVSYVVSNTFAKRIIETKVTESVSQIFHQIEEKMHSFDSDMEGIANFLFYSPTIQAYMSTDDVLTRVLGNQEVLSVFANTVSLKQNIRGIQLFDKEGHYLASLGAGSIQSVPAPIQSIDYSGLIDLPISDPKDSKRSFYAISVPIYELNNSRLASEFAGVGRFFMDASNFSPILNSARITDSSQVMLLDQEHRPIAVEGNLVLPEAFKLEDWENDSRYIVQTITLPRSHWQLVSLIPKDELLEELDTVKRLNFFTYLLMVGILGLFLFIFFTRIFMPIKGLMDFIKSYPRRGGDNRYQVVYNNEIGALGKNLNKMLDDIDSLSHEVQTTQARMYEIELSKKQMEISAFRNQINPHFLYNTLESIRAVALYHEVEMIADISSSLSNMFRYAVKGNNFVAIKDEISHIREYAKIIEFRFMGRFKIHIDADDDVLEQQMLKMLLQPIVENAVFHGLERKLGEGSVAIEIRRAEPRVIQCTIRDDGQGMDEDQYQWLIHQLQHAQENDYLNNGMNKGIGLFNIYRRLKLFYGEEARLSIESALRQGTTVVIAFPVQISEG